MRIYLGLANFCNLSCKYCYRHFYPSHNTLSHTCLNFGAINKLINLLEESCIQEKIHVILHGNDPLVVGFEYLKELFSLFARSKLSFSYNLQTNLVALNEDMIQLFDKYNVSIGTSLDGPQSIHDAVRIFKNGKGSFKIVMEKINLLRKHKINTSVICVVTKRSIGKESSIYNFFKSLELDFSISPIICMNGCCSEELALKSWEYAGFFNEIAEIYLYDTNLKNHILTIDGYIKKILFSTNKKPGYCYDDILFIDQDASLYRCGRFAGSPEFCIGNLYDIKDFSRIFLNPQNIRYEMKVQNLVTQCIDCDIFEFCGGGCLHSAITNNTIPFDEFTCNYTKQIIPALINTVHQSMKARPSFIAAFS